MSNRPTDWPKDTVKPLSPSEIASRFSQNIDPVIINAVNNLLEKNYSEGHITFKQDDLEKEAIRLKGLAGNAEINKQVKKWYDEHQFDIEDVFRKVGWSVSYDKPGYNETYPATYTFKKKKRK